MELKPLNPLTTPGKGQTAASAVPTVSTNWMVEGGEGELSKS